jgi:polysaccharide biosynthesis/export protein
MIPKLSKAIPSAAALLALQACTGLYLDLPDEGSGRDIDVEVQPITPELVARQVQPKVAVETSLIGVTGPYVYRVGLGDILDISIPSIVSAPFATTTPAYPTTREPDRGYTVAPDGTIWLPYVGPIKVAGSTIREVQDQVVKELSRFIKTPQVSVSVTQFRSQKVLVAGQVPKPGYLPVTDVPLTLVGALTLAGSTPQMRGDLVARALTAQQLQQIPESGDYRRVLLTRAGKVETLDALAVLRSGDLRQDPLLQDGDVVYVSPVERAYVYVLGEVREPALMEVVEKRTSLAEVLMAAGGISQVSAKAGRVYVIRGQLDKPDVFQLNANEADALLLADAFVVRPRDVVYVAEANISRWNRFLSQLAPTLQSLITGGLLNSTLNE